MKLRKTIVVLLSLALGILSAAALAEAGADGALGQPLADFTVTTIAGETFTLSEALLDRDLVLINLWATWCGPCEAEFPYLEEAWELYQDRVAVIALSVEPNDTEDVLSEYVAAHGITFPVANEGALGLSRRFVTEGIPTTVIVDRFGNVAFIEVGSQPSTAAFTRVFDYFLSEDYTETAVLDGVPPMRPAAENPSGAELDAALNVEGGALSFRCADDGFTWPMLPAEKDGRSVLASSNAGLPETEAAVFTSVNARAGDALAFDFACSTEGIFNLFTVSVDGVPVKTFRGARDFSTWTIALTPGAHEIAFAYSRMDPSPAGGAEGVWLDDVRLLSGDEAAAALAALPVYPVSDAFSLAVQSEGAREIVFDDPYGLIPTAFAAQRAYIVSGNEAILSAALTAEMDPEEAFFYLHYTDSVLPLENTLADGAYTLAVPVEQLRASEYAYGAILLYSSAYYESDEDIRGVLLFAGEENADAFVEEVRLNGYPTFAWAYADGADPEAASESGESSDAVYRVIFADQNGDPVPGCVVNFCTDTSCTPVVSDENGVAVFTGAPFAYHLQVIRVPEGYEFEPAQALTVGEAGGDLEFTVTKKQDN